MPLYAGIEMGGTKTIAVLGQPGLIRERVEFATTTPDETLGEALRVIAHWQDAAPVAALGVAAFGPVRLARDATDYGTILATPKADWQGARVIERLANGFAGPIALDTDVNAAALAEHQLGAGQGCGALVYLTIGTGVGGGILIDGRPVHGRLHPELGHLRLRRAPDDAFAGACPFHGACVEGLISGPALAARFGRSPAEVDRDDPAWEWVAADLAEFLANLLLALSPERIIVGGGVIMRQPWLLKAAIERVPERLAGYLDDLDLATLERLVVLPQLGNDAGPNGSLCLARGAAPEDQHRP